MYEYSDVGIPLLGYERGRHGRLSLNWDETKGICTCFLRVGKAAAALSSTRLGAEVCGTLVWFAESKVSAT